MRKIPLFIHEEHHEAFILWNYAVQQKIIPTCNNTLLHVDGHSDLKIPRINQPIPSIGDHLQKICEFAHNELTISTFLVPVFYQGMFKNFKWLLQQNTPRNKECMVVSVLEKNKIVFRPENKIDEAVTYSSKRTDTEFTKVKKVYLEMLQIDSSFPQKQKVVLDIDLDYFSANDNNDTFCGCIEITKEEYSKYLENPYHNMKIRAHQFAPHKVLQKDNRYYLSINEFKENHKSTSRVQKKVILKRIDDFIFFLRRHLVKPLLVNICRSRLSGYTPEDQWDFIEKQLIDKLENLYEIENRGVNKLLRNYVRNSNINVPIQ